MVARARGLTLMELLVVPIQVAGGETWPLPHVSASAQAVFRAVGIPDPKACFKADIAALKAPTGQA